MTSISRRRFISLFSRGSASIAVLGAVGIACSDDGTQEGLSPTTERPTTTAGGGAATTAAADTTVAPSTTAAATSTTAGAGDPVAWERVNFGFVSAYVLERNGEAALVDTGVGGGEAAIEEALTQLGLSWDDLGHVILTHSHGDHVGSLDAVLAAAPAAAGYIGEGDLAAVSSSRPLQPVNDGDRIFDLRIIGSPGHTPGHISVFDPASLLLVAGDAINESGGSVTGANPQFTSDQATADQSVASLSQFTPDTILFGHGEPIIGGAAPLLTDLAVSL